MISVSIVLYKTPKAQLDMAVESVLESKLVSRLFLVDNLPEGGNPYPGRERIVYINKGRNLGYGAGNNVVLLDASLRSELHLAMNPDVHFKPGTLEALSAYMDSHPDVGLVMPKILSADGALQHQCKLLPTPFDLVLRRFLPAWLCAGSRARFELRHFDYAHEMDIPYLNGSFMLLRSSVVDRVGGFDERIFMYGEDIDISRRFYAQSRAVFFPGATIVHEHQRSSYKKLPALLQHCVGIAAYFNKWGWLLDPERGKANKATLQRIEECRKASKA